MEQPRPRSGDVTIQRDALARRMYRRSLVTGEITLPAVPDMIDEYVSMCETLFAGVGRAFTAEQLGQVRSVFQGQLAEAYANSPRSNIVITFDVVGRGRLRKLDQYAQATTVWNRTGCPRVEFGDRSARCRDVSGARYRRRNGPKHPGVGAAGPPGRGGGDDPEVSPRSSAPTPNGGRSTCA